VQNEKATIFISEIKTEFFLKRIEKKPEFANIVR
jgi:hypothetical protein